MTTAPHSTRPHSTRDDREQAHFSTLAADWWNEKGPLATLHQFNPARLSYLLQCWRAHSGQPAEGRTPLKGLKLLDIGCGGGIFAEGLARMGAQVTGLDTVPEAIEAATVHAAESGLHIQYRCGTVEELSENRTRYDIITASEVIEHVADPALFIRSCAALLKPQGMLFITTPNRTLKSYALGIMVAEQLTGLIPRGTHEWKKFLKPSELASLLQENGLQVGGLTGVRYHPLSQTVDLVSQDVSLNYMLWASY